MRTSRPAAVALITAAAALIPAALTAAPASAADATDTVIVTCVGKEFVKPKQIVVTCADAGVTVGKITWSRWDANRARGTGTLTWNTCLPTTCADGIVETYAVRITLGRVASGPEAAAFTRMTLGFPDGGPAAAETATYTLDNARR
jgi:hypothetical protein